MPGRFTLGVGSGEALNEHILGDHWPPAQVRLQMLEEAIEVIRSLWDGKLTSHRGTHYTVENARIYSLPEKLPANVVAASGDDSIDLAAKVGDGVVALDPDSKMVGRFRKKAGGEKPAYCEVTACWASSEDAARKTVKERWPIAGLGGQLNQELAQPALYEAAAQPLSEDQVSETSRSARTPTSTSPPPRSISMRVTTTSGSTRSATTRTGSSSSTPTRFCRSSGHRVSEGTALGSVTRWQPSGTARGRRPRGEGQQPGQDLLSRARHHQAPTGRVLHRGGSGALTGALNRPTTLHRFPDGVTGEDFYQKRIPKHRPDWIESTTIRFPSGRSAEMLRVVDIAHIAWAINLGCLESNRGRCGRRMSIIQTN